MLWSQHRHTGQVSGVWHCGLFPHQIAGHSSLPRASPPINAPKALRAFLHFTSAGKQTCPAGPSHTEPPRQAGATCVFLSDLVCDSSHSLSAKPAMRCTTNITRGTLAKSATHQTHTLQTGHLSSPLPFRFFGHNFYVSHIYSSKLPDVRKSHCLKDCMMGGCFPNTKN